MAATFDPFRSVAFHANVLVSSNAYLVEMPILDLVKQRKRRADRLHEEGMALSAAGDDDGALKKYLAATKLNPEKAPSFYNIGLIYKYRSEWEKAFDFNDRAYRLAPTDESSRWNLAIAATALRRWEVARQMWADQGIKLDGDSGPINMDLGKTPVRLHPDGDGEVVWATRIDPVRARIDSVPLPDSGFRCGDIVLHDGAAVGHRKVGNHEYPVFNVLELVKASSRGTFRALASVANAEDVDRLQKLALERGIEVEDWTSSIRVLCRQCSEGTPHDEHDEDLKAEEWVPNRRLGIGAQRKADVESLLHEWCASSSAELIDLECHLEPRSHSE